MELTGLCHSQFKPGPPSEEAQVYNSLKIIIKLKMTTFVEVGRSLTSLNTCHFTCGSEA